MGPTCWIFFLSQSSNRFRQRFGQSFDQKPKVSATQRLHGQPAARVLSFLWEDLCCLGPGCALGALRPFYFFKHLSKDTYFYFGCFKRSSVERWALLCSSWLVLGSFGLVPEDQGGHFVTRGVLPLYELCFDWWFHLGG
jgi:hypothetical protein